MIERNFGHFNLSKESPSLGMFSVHLQQTLSFLFMWKILKQLLVFSFAYIICTNYARSATAK